MNDEAFRRHLQRLLKEWEEDKHLTTIQAIEKRSKKQADNKPRKTRK